MPVKKKLENNNLAGRRNNEIEQRDRVATKKKYWLRLTRNCNNRCLFCLDKDAQNGTALPLENILAELKKGRRGDFDQVILSGGEATLHPEFLAVIKAAKEMGYSHIQVITNGRMFAYEDFLHRAVINGVKEITFSIHGHNAKLHDYQTGIRGSFEQAISALKNSLKIPGLIVNVDIVISKINYKHLYAMLKYFIGLGVSEFDLLQVIPFGRAWDNRKLLFYDIKKALPHLKKAFKLSERPDLSIWTNRFPAQYLEGLEQLIQHPAKLYDEIRGRKEMFNYFLGEARPMACHGERCKYCFLEDFCSDLIELGKNGYLSAKEGPFCSGFYSGDCRRIYKEKIVDIFEFLDFYIKNRYFLKGDKCGQCALNDKCGGMQCDSIRICGFKALKPIRKK